MLTTVLYIYILYMYDTTDISFIVVCCVHGVVCEWCGVRGVVYASCLWCVRGVVCEWCGVVWCAWCGVCIMCVVCAWCGVRGVVCAWCDVCVV